MYHLTCPSCSCVTESPFVRNGAVVRCGTCQAKYRIKSSHIDRVVLTGPKTLDETEAVLRSDSVDIDPDEAAPVSIDDDGNVVGLSGLSELMRFNDSQGTKQKLKKRASDEADAKPPPKAKTTATSEPDMPERGPAARSRARELSRKRKRNNTIIIGSLVTLLLIAVGVIIVLTTSKGNDGTDTAEQNEEGGDNPDSGNNPQPEPQNPPDNDPDGGIFVRPDPNPNPDPNDPDGGDPDSGNPDAVARFQEPEPARDFRFEPPWAPPDPSVLPLDVPTVLTPSTPVLYEGWYISRQGRGEPEAGREPDIDLSELTPSPLDDERTRLSCTVHNRSSRTILRGDLHVMLQNGRGDVFAETYIPLVMIGPDERQEVSLPIATRHWNNKRDTRVRISEVSWIDEVQPLSGVRLDPVGRLGQAAVRVSVLHQDVQPLRSVMIVLEATNEQGDSVARFVVSEENLYVQRGHWLDLVVATPLQDYQQAAEWSAMIQPR